VLPQRNPVKEYPRLPGLVKPAMALEEVARLERGLSPERKCKLSER